MFISKKKLAFEIDKAVYEKEQMIQAQRELDDRFRYIREDMDHGMLSVSRRMDDILFRLDRIEKLTGIAEEDKNRKTSEIKDVKCCDPFLY